MNAAMPSEPDNWTLTQPADASLIHYHGRNVLGESIDESVPGPIDVAELVRSLYEAGCLALVVRRGDVEVGGIDRDSNTGERTWWAEAQPPNT